MKVTKDFLEKRVIAYFEKDLYYVVLHGQWSRRTIPIQEEHDNPGAENTHNGQVDSDIGIIPITCTMTCPRAA